MDMRNFYRRNLPVLLVLGIILALAGAGAAKQAAALPAGSWGLSFQQEGQPPVGNTTADRLRQYDAAFLGDTAQKRIYLTFDAGYENGCTAQILDALQKHHAPAAFFLVGNYIERNPDLVRRMAQEGHTVGNHTYHHWDMSKIGEMEQFRQELESLETLYRDTTGQELAKFYRPPQGIYSEKNLEMAQQLGYHTVFWSLALAKIGVGTAGDRAEAILCAILENDHDRQYNAGDHLEDQENQLQGIHSKKPPKTAAVTAAACRNQPKGRIYIQCLQ